MKLKKNIENGVKRFNLEIGPIQLITPTKETSSVLTINIRLKMVSPIYNLHNGASFNVLHMRNLEISSQQ